jgi:hypothetical protein
MSQRPMNPALLDALQAVMDGADSTCTHPLDALEALRELAIGIEALTDRVMAEAVAGAYSRRELAGVLGVTRQAVQQRLARIESGTPDTRESIEARLDRMQTP